MNPYSKMLEIMRMEGSKFNPPSILLGKVISISPLTVKVGNVQIDKDNILISEDLTKYNVINTGDQLAILPTSDRQLFILLCKVVKP